MSCKCKALKKVKTKKIYGGKIIDKVILWIK